MIDKLIMLTAITIHLGFKPEKVFYYVWNETIRLSSSPSVSDNKTRMDYQSSEEVHDLLMSCGHRL